jgi:hypothetical protein
MDVIKTYSRKALAAFVIVGISVFGLVVLATPAFAGVGGSVVPDYPTPVTVGQTGLAATLTITNGSTGANTTENVSVSNISHAPSCGSTANTTCQLANADLGVFAVHNGMGRVATACAGTTFTASAPDASGNVIFTPSVPVVLGPSSGPLSGSQCIIDFTVDVLKVPTIDASAAAGVQTDELSSGQFLGQTSGLNGTGSGSTQTTVNKASPTVSTVLSTTTAMTGTSVHDTATLSGATPTAGGSATYTVFTNNTCSSGAQSAGTKTVTNGIIPNSDPIVFNSAGTFYWQVVYSGDANNNAATSTCTSEIVTITTPPPPPGVQYCSPGYWKQSQHFDSYPTPYLATSTFNSVFGSSAFPGKTLVQVLSQGGGGLAAFGRATVGGLLNAGALSAGTSTAGVISTFNAVFNNAPSGNANGYYGSAQSLFTAPENCPLN